MKQAIAIAFLAVLAIWLGGAWIEQNERRACIENTDALLATYRKLRPHEAQPDRDAVLRVKCPPSL